MAYTRCVDTFCVICIFTLGCRDAYDPSKLGVLRSLNKKVTGSSQDSNIEMFDLSHAVDGHNETVSKCLCCAATDKQDKPPWIQIDLGRLFRVATVEVIGTTEVYPENHGLVIYVSKTSTDWMDNLEDFLAKVDVSKPYHNVTLEYPVIAQFVTLLIPEKAIFLAVCEVNIYSRDCSPGTYGLHCEEMCDQYPVGETCDHVTGTCISCKPLADGDTPKEECPAGFFGRDCFCHCLCSDNQACDPTTGSCPDRKCDPGWRGDNCSIVCTPGTYGSNCVNKCGKCYNTEVCDRKTGVCTLCDPGYKGLRCDQECTQGTYGLNCSKTCDFCKETCDVITGTCKTGCLAGYQGSLCIEICMSGTYGLGCTGICGKCQDGNTCDHVTGTCKQCTAGFLPFLCKEECSPGTYGGNCSLTCGHCRDADTCDGRSGFCELCQPGYTGETCHQECSPGTYGGNCSLACGHCLDAVTCDRESGLCELCQPGYTGETCHQECSPGTYGGNCSLACGHCLNAVTCDRKSGRCELCQPGYTGETCHQDAPCPAQTYGLDCTACGFCNNGSCDPVTGDCPSGCHDGYIGNKCDALKRDTFFNNATYTTSGMSTVNIGIVGAGVSVAILIIISVVTVAIYRTIKRRAHIYEEPQERSATETNTDSNYASLEERQEKQEDVIYENDPRTEINDAATMYLNEIDSF